MRSPSSHLTVEELTALEVLADQPESTARVLSHSVDYGDVRLAPNSQGQQAQHSRQVTYQQVPNQHRAGYIWRGRHRRQSAHDAQALREFLSGAPTLDEVARAQEFYGIR
jgi:hypothetical protein